VIYPGHPRNPDAVLWVAVDAKGRNKERANDTTCTEEETKAETERIERSFAKSKQSTNLVLTSCLLSAPSGSSASSLQPARDESKVGDPLLFTVFELAAIAVMTDADHVKAEADIAAAKCYRAARVAHLQSELPAIIARKAKTFESKKLLTQFDNLASQIGDVLDKLKLIKADTEAVNAALRSIRSLGWSRATQKFIGLPPAR
jgi:hypothetical protein